MNKISKKSIAGAGFSLLMIASASAWASDSLDSAQGLESAFAPATSMLRMQQALQDLESDRDIGPLFRGEKDGSALSLAARVTGDVVETTKLQHFFQGIEVLGSMAFHHRGRAGTTIRNAIRSFDLDANPSISAEQAVAIAQGEAGERSLSKLPELKILPTEEGAARLIYWVDLAAADGQAGSDVLVDAHTGEVIANLSKHIELDTESVLRLARHKPSHPAPGTGSEPAPAPVSGRTSVEAYNAARMGIAIDQQGAGSKTSVKVTDLATGKTQVMAMKQAQALANSECQVLMQGDPIMVNPEDCKLQVQNGNAVPGADASAVRAAKNSEVVLAYYQSHLNRNSYDNHGSTLVSVVHSGDHYDNAHWDTEKNHMVYGDGDGKELGDFTLALDVAGHEMSHGVTAHTAGLLGMGESGALNEANSDFFGVLIAGAKDWAIGKALFLDQAKATGVRDLADPAKVPYPIRKNGQVVKIPGPANIKDLIKPTAGMKCDGSNDACYVHGNATIPGHAYYLEFMAIGQEKAEKLHYATLTQALSKTDTIRSAANAEKQMCRQMYDTATCAKVDQAWAQVGL